MVLRNSFLLAFYIIPKLMSIWTWLVLQLTLLNNFVVNLGMLHQWLPQYFLGVPINSMAPSTDADDSPAQLPCMAAYQSLFGSIGWLATGTWPDLSPVHSFLLSYNRKPSTGHLQAAPSMQYTTSTPLMTTAFISHHPIWIQFTLLCTSLTHPTLKLTLMPNLPLLQISHILHPTVMLVGALRSVLPSGMEPYFLFLKHVAWVVELLSIRVDLSLGPQFAKREHLSVHARQKFELLMKFQNWWWVFAISPTVFELAATTSMILRPLLLIRSSTMSLTTLILCQIVLK